MAGLRPESLVLSDFSDRPMSVCGKAFRAHMSGALYWPAEDALIVADLHLEKGSHFAARGQMLPPYDTRETLRKLAEVIDAYDAASIIALGDSFHDAVRSAVMCSMNWSSKASRSAMNPRRARARTRLQDTCTRRRGW